jgi:hypothetical protein
MVGKFIYSLLTGAPTYYSTDPDNAAYRINKEVAGRIYPNIKPQTVGTYGTNLPDPSPYIIYTVEKNDPSDIKGYTRSPRNNYDITIDVVDSSYSTVTRISSLIIDLLSRYKNPINSVTDIFYGTGIKSSAGHKIWGEYCPPSTGLIQYFGGIQVIAMNFENCLETYNDDLYEYRNILNFTLSTKDDFSTWGADISLNIHDLNLMATNINSTDDPLYTQPVAMDQGVNYLYSPSCCAETNNVSDTSSNGMYDIWYDDSGTVSNPSNTNRPNIKKSIVDLPYTIGSNYLEFGTSKYLRSLQLTERRDRKYKEGTAFFVMDIPDSITSSKESAILYGDTASGTYPSGMIYAGCVSVSGGAVLKMNFGGIGLQEDGKDRGLNFTSGTIISWPFLGINPTLTLTKPFFIAVSFRRKPDDNTKVEGKFDFVASSDFTDDGADNNIYYGYSDASYLSDWAEYFFNFSTIHTDVSNYDPEAGGWIDPINPNAAMNLYDMVVWPEYLEFGSNKYMKIKKEIIGKYGWWKKTSN